MNKKKWKKEDIAHYINSRMEEGFVLDVTIADMGLYFLNKTVNYGNFIITYGFCSRRQGMLLAGLGIDDIHYEIDYSCRILNEKLNFDVDLELFDEQKFGLLLQKDYIFNYFLEALVENKLANDGSFPNNVDEIINSIQIELNPAKSILERIR